MFKENKICKFTIYNVNCIQLLLIVNSKNFIFPEVLLISIINIKN
jgi:hypothetical protein